MPHVDLTSDPARWGPGWDRDPIGFTTENADADHADLRARGVDVDEQVMRMGDPVPPMFFFRDQDGNSLLIVERG